MATRTRPRTGFATALPAIVWLRLFFLLPLIFIFVGSFLTRERGGGGMMPFTFANYARVFEVFSGVLVDSIWIAALTTLICLLLGYPLAFWIATRKQQWVRSLALFMIILPFWTNFLVRTYSLQTLMSREGILNSFFGTLGIIAQPLEMLNGIDLLMSGYDENSENPDEIEAAKQYLLEHSANVAAIVAANSKQLLSQGKVDMAVDYNGNVFGLMAECAADPNCTTEYAYTIPVEGASVWKDNLAIPVGAQNPTLANVFIDYILHPQVSADISNYVTYGTPSQAALDLGLINPESLANPNLYPPPEVRANLFQIRPVSPEAEVLYNNACDELTIAISGN